jgi:hypothetical protein
VLRAWIQRRRTSDLFVYRQNRAERRLGKLQSAPLLSASMPPYMSVQFFPSVGNTSTKFIGYAIQRVILRLVHCEQASFLFADGLAHFLTVPLAGFQTCLLTLSGQRTLTTSNRDTKTWQWSREFNVENTFATSCPASNGSSCDWAQRVPPESGESALLFPLPDSEAYGHTPWRTPGQRCPKYPCNKRRPLH